MTLLAHDIYTDSCNGHWRIERDSLGKAVHLHRLDESLPLTTRSLSGWAALQEYLADAGDFEAVRAAVKNPPRSPVAPTGLASAWPSGSWPAARRSLPCSCPA